MLNICNIVNQNKSIQAFQISFVIKNGVESKHNGLLKGNLSSHQLSSIQNNK